MDLQFDVVNRELIMKNNDFATTTNPSVQNGGILAYSRGANPLAPMFGIGLVPQVINGPAPNLAVELNRWVVQAFQDGATLCKWTGQAVAREADVDLKISYL